MFICRHIYNHIHISLYIVDEHRAVATVSPPFQTYLVDGCRSPSCFKGVYADTFHKLKETMNFTFTIEWVKAFGGVKNGQWTGMIGIEYIHFKNFFGTSYKKSPFAVFLTQDS